MKILPVIICGGAGSRLWPLSRRSEPKQFARLIRETTLFQQTLARFTADAFLPAAIICNADHEPAVREQAAELGAPLGTVVLEPMGRNTAACGVVSAMLGEQAGADAVLMAPADHHITRPEDFTAVVLKAAPLVAEGHLVTFGITATEPHTGFGYIETGEPLSVGHRVARFREKPSREVAMDYLATGRFHWNAGIFMFAPGMLLAEFQAHAPDVLSAVRRSADADLTLDADHFADVPSISFDYAIAERTEHAAVIEADMGWSDIGSYSALFALRSEQGQPSAPRAPS